jgi:succinoglycan biosynthesis protein ExoM
VGARRPEVSVCIASSRAEGLARLLESLARQKLPPGVDCELIVVDDSPCDASRAAAEAWRGPGPLRRFEQPRGGIAHARNRAVDEARGRWLAFVDDDESADEEWLAEYLARARRGEADGLFGPVLPRLEREGPRWLAPERFFARPRHASGTLLSVRDLRTSNAFLRAPLFQGRRFDPAFSRSGGSDTELFARMLRAGAHFEWCDEARVVEWIPPERHRPRWLARRAFRGGYVWTRLERRWRPARSSTRALARGAAAAALFALATPFALLRGRAAALALWLRACTQAGHVWAALGRAFEEYRASR